MTTTVAGEVRRLVGVEATGVLGSGMDASPISRLMFYLGCVESVCKFGIPREFTNYHEWDKLSYNALRALLRTAAICTPELLMEHNLFVPSTDLVPVGYDNEFYDLKDERIRAAVSDKFCMAGRDVTVICIMAFRPAWLENNYVIPMKRAPAMIEEREGKKKRKKREKTTQKVQVVKPMPVFEEYSSTSSVPPQPVNLVRKDPPRSKGCC